jgi:cytochrome P450
MSAQERETLLTCLGVNMREYIFPNPMKNMIGHPCPSRWTARRKPKELMVLTKNTIREYRKNAHPNKGTVIESIVHKCNYRNEDKRVADMINLIVAGHDTR